MRRVLFIARRFPPSVGGMERFAYDLNKALNRKTILKSITWGGPNRWLPVVFPLFFIKAFFTLLFNRNVCVIHVQDAVQAPMGWLLSKIFQLPYVIVAHGLDITYEKFLYQKITLPFVRKADAVISISTATEKEVLARGLDNKKSYVITPGSGDDYIKPVANKSKLGEAVGIDIKGKVLLLTTGRLVKRKGVAWFVDNVMPDLLKKHPKVVYFVVGEGDDRLEIEKKIKLNKLEDHVIMLGRVSDDFRSLFYQSSDIFIMPNILVPGDMEGFGIVAHEAALAKLPVIASGIEGIIDAVKHNKNGKLVQSGDKTAFIEETCKMLNSVNERHSFGEKAREYTLTNYSWEVIAERYMEVYEKVCGYTKKP